MSSSYFIFLFYANITQIICLIFISAVGLAESQDAAWQPGLQLPIGSFKANPDEPGKRIDPVTDTLMNKCNLAASCPFVQPCWARDGILEQLF
jgi:hypothetical protein